MPPDVKSRRFPPPWTIDEMNDACFIVRDKNGQQLGYFYFEEEPGRRTAAHMLTKDEARRLAVNFRQGCRSCCGGDPTGTGPAAAYVSDVAGARRKSPPYPTGALAH
jgi:hypothetical protein